jgi:helix-turn-helix protein
MGIDRPLRVFVDELPREQLPELKGALEARLLREVLKATAPPAPPPSDARGLLSTRAAADYLDCSPDEIRDRVRRGTLAAVRDRPGGRLHFDPAALEDYKAGHCTVVSGANQRYNPHHDIGNRPSPPPSPRVDAAPARSGAQRHRDNDHPLGSRRTRSNAARRNRPYAPGKGAWTDPTTPSKPRVDD